jgi:hypothetical protein
MSRPLVLLILCLVAAFARPALAERPQLIIDRSGPVDLVELPPNALLPYNTIYVNRCANGCTIKVGQPSSINNTWYLNSQRTLTAFPYGDEVWKQVVDCVKDVFEPFNVNITETDPGTANHFEVMIAGAPGDLGMSDRIGGIAPGSSCNGYVNNALVFDFAKVWGSGTTCGANCVENICATAAQELGHAWRGLDHVIDNKDPMTYFNYSGRKYFQNVGSICGSDCVNGSGPDGQPCSGTNNQQRSCKCGATQNSYAIMTDLFGAGPGSPPTVKITSPKLGASVEPGFAIAVDPSDNSGIITKVEVKVDGVLVGELTKGPFVFNAPSTLANGTHKVEAIAYDPHQTPGVATINVIIGPPCGKPADCPSNTDTCVGGRCVPGAGVQGGLGTSCAANTECASGLCANDGSNQYCVEGCLVGQCPDDFGCLEVDNPSEGTTGVCWPGHDDGSGGCGCQTSRGGPLSMLVLFGWVVLTCRRRRARS